MRRRWAAVAIMLVASCGRGITDDAGVRRIELTPASATIRTGASLPISATVRDESGTIVNGAQLFWSSSDTSIATVSSAGVVLARKPGAAKVAVTALGVSATAAVTVSNREVAAVQVTPAAVTVRVGASTPLSARTSDAQGADLTGRVVAWTTDNAAVASVNADGVVSGQAAGTATITATSEGKSGSAVVTVQLVPVATVHVSPSLDTLTIGESVQLAATTRDANGVTLNGRSIGWTSANGNVVGVSSTGLVTANGLGSTTVQATAEGRSGTATLVVVQRPVATVTLTPGNGSVVVGGTLALAVRTTDAAGNTLAGRAVSYTSSNNAVATVGATGVVSGQSAGTVTITATSEGRSGTAQVRVDPQPVNTVEVAPSAGTVIIGDNLQLTASARSSSGALLTGRAVTWRSGAPGIVGVSTTGLVTALTEGIAIVTAEVEGVMGSSTITVRRATVAAVTLSPATETLSLLGSVQLTPTVIDGNGNILTGRTVSWTSSDNLVALVSSTGRVSALKNGVATITATVEGVSGTSRITVR
ncbi:MAG TPA: Ig-like domain-containing protein [Gemmatimonas sp.]|nr:Ig-like domain-containing protein [Gemmatimonas sp.]